MHEATLAENIIKISLDIAEKNHAKKISAVGLKLGKMSGVEVEALNLSFEVLTRGTPAENAKLRLEKIPIRAQCNTCKKFFTLENFNFFCPECDGILILQSGRELLIDFVDCE